MPDWFCSMVLVAVSCTAAASLPAPDWFWVAVLNGAEICFTSAMLVSPNWFWVDTLSSANA
ncbi:hypothetical protein D3C85_1721220 [compost metagenome]